MAAITEKSKVRAAQGTLKRFEFTSTSLGGMPTTFAIFLPDAAESKKLPVVYWLSGLTCTDENMSQKGGAFQAASDHGLILVISDTSPRGEGVPDEEPHTYEFGVGAGFYLNATPDKYKKHYNMYDFIVNELPAVVEANFPVTDTRSIAGHSMGGHGALTIGMKNPDRFQSVSAFAPICNPMECPWGKKAFPLYLGDDKETWKQYDATELMKKYSGKDLHILCDQGDADNFLIGDANQLCPDNFKAAAKEAGVTVNFRTQAGYDHGFYFISTFIADHLAHHASFLNSKMCGGYPA